MDPLVAKIREKIMERPPLYTSKKKHTVELTEGEIEALLEAAETLGEVLDKEEKDTGERLSPEDRHMLRVLGRGASKLNAVLPLQPQS